MVIPMSNAAHAQTVNLNLLVFFTAFVGFAARRVFTDLECLAALPAMCVQTSRNYVQDSMLSPSQLIAIKNTVRARCHMSYISAQLTRKFQSGAFSFVPCKRVCYVRQRTNGRAFRQEAENHRRTDARIEPVFQIGQNCWAHECTRLHKRLSQRVQQQGCRAQPRGGSTASSY